MQVSETTGNNNIYLTDKQKKTQQTLDKDAFLQLFITQLRYQDPTSPQDTSQFASQIAQFTMLEQLTNLNTAINKLLEMNQLNHAATLIGREVVVATDKALVSGLVDKVTVDKEGVKIWVTNQSYTLDQVVSFAGLTQAAGENTEGGAATGDNSEQMPAADATLQSGQQDSTG
ncbi:flagellar hook assembly protein FlgD [Desulfotomaculum varum]